jgi:predicted RNA binding protein YcfA (HicA-like mRNA interferase family)
VPRKIRELINDLETAGFVNRGGKGSHRNFVHPDRIRPVTIPGNSGDDAQIYLENIVEKAIREVSNGKKR